MYYNFYSRNTAKEYSHPIFAHEETCEWVGRGRSNLARSRCKELAGLRQKPVSESKVPALTAVLSSLTFMLKSRTGRLPFKYSYSLSSPPTP